MVERVFYSAEAYRESKSALKLKYGPYLINGFRDPIIIQHKIDEEYVKADGTKETYERSWASYRLSEMPGCCGLAISYNAWVDPNIREYGLGEYFHKERLKLVKDSGYSCIICTVTAENVKQQNLLTKQGWHEVHSFNNRRTKNDVQIWVKNLTEV